MKVVNPMASMFLRKNRDIVAGIVDIVNEQQVTNRRIIEAATQSKYPVKAWTVDGVLGLVDSHGPEAGLSAPLDTLKRQMLDVRTVAAAIRGDTLIMVEADA